MACLCRSLQCQWHLEVGHAYLLYGQVKQAEVNAACLVMLLQFVLILIPLYFSW